MNSPERFRRALAGVRDDPAAAAKRAERVRRHLGEHFTWDAVFATIKAIAGGA